MLRKFILFLIRKKFGVNKYQQFKFAEQKHNGVYYFTESNLLKHWRGQTMISGVSFNWLMDPNCKIEKL